ncbi:MAG TPA: DNA sulfur modification protein DndB [Nocardia sp.]|uniref:DNA sulfur modification protein DndB n=1 Tax=Nocardia TaxID=1817 RepID=UPI002457AC2D|nr:MULTISPECIES: DNA sulfur modification protein DndB [Nocardia]HLS78894.1 DNA sulfur modification protein DndB [Nocardia sp.]
MSDHNIGLREHDGLDQALAAASADAAASIGRVAYEIRKSPNLEWRQEMYKRLATEVDWRREGAVWQGSILSADGKITTQRGPVREAVHRVKAQLGLLPLELTV